MKERKALGDFDWVDAAVLGLVAAVSFALLALAGGGCAPIPVVFIPSGDEPDIEVYSASSESAAADARGARGQSQVGPESAAADSVPFSALQWCWGGFNGAGAQAVAGCRIAGLSVQSHGMSYKWEAGGCETLGASSRSDAACIAALFVRDAKGAWRGGKFDWISTGRTTRDFANIETGYGGWPTTAINNASAYAFVIVSEDGRRRSNTIVQEVHR